MNKGFGLFANRSIPAGSVVVEYCGEVIRREEVASRLKYQTNGIYILEVRECYR